MSEQMTPKPDYIEFHDAASNRLMRYFYQHSEKWYRGWICYRHADGGWVTLRKATDADLAAISDAVVQAHHGGSNA